MKWVKILELALGAARQADLPQLLLLRASEQVTQRRELATGDLAARFLPLPLELGMVGQHNVFPVVLVQRQHKTDRLTVAGEQQGFPPAHGLQQSWCLVTKLTDADDAHRDHCSDDTAKGGFMPRAKGGGER